MAAMIIVIIAIVTRISHEAFSILSFVVLKGLQERFLSNVSCEAATGPWIRNAEWAALN